MRKRLLLCVGAVGLLGLGAAFLYLVLVPQRTRFAREDFDRIQVGMTEQEVAAFLRAPAGNYIVALPGTAGVHSIDLRGRRLFWEKEWRCNEAVIEVWFDKDGLVAEKYFYELNIPVPSPLERLRARLGW